MKNILGLDLGTTSIGWAFVNEAETNQETSSIVKIGVRVIPLTTDEESDFQKGKAISLNADRTLKRGARRNLDRYQLRRKELIEILIENKIISKTTLLNEDGKKTTFSTYKLRARAADEKISLNDFGKVLLMINKKRGYKSSRKAKTEDEGTAIDGMEIAKYLYENNFTPGQYGFKILESGKKYIPDFYRSDLQKEFHEIWDFQQKFYPTILTVELWENLKNKNKTQTWAICRDPFKIVGVKQSGGAQEKKRELYLWRVNGLNEQLNLEQLAIVFSEINNQISNSSGYLGAISDRSKELYFYKQTVGQFLFKQLEQNRHSRLKNQVFYRQDYLDEFNILWEKQKEFYPELTDELKKEIRDVIIFYQRRLKSQKHLISNCEFEKYHKVIPKSSPLFQEFKIWQILNNLELTNLISHEKFCPSLDAKELLFNELNIKEKLSNSDVLKVLVKNPKEFDLNYKDIEGNRTNAALYSIYEKILEFEGEECTFSKMKSDEINEIVSTKFLELGFNTEILFFDADAHGNEFDKQPLMKLWHLLYSAEDDKNLAKIISEKFGFNIEYAKLFVNIPLQGDYGNLSAKAIRKILPYLKKENTYDLACSYAGYNHSSFLTKEELTKRELKGKLDLLPKNSLRNPVVEKILNQMINVVNAIINDKNLGKPDEIRIELARELKKSAKEREIMTKNINAGAVEHDMIRNLLRTDFGISKVTKNDITRYKLWKELETNGFKTLYTNTYISKEKLFSKEFDIEHIIPQARLFDDSFSNKTLSVRSVNIEKGNYTAYDYLIEKYNESEFNQYLTRVEKMYKTKVISKAKYNKLLMKGSNIPDDFIERDLRNSQYIAKKAKQMLEEVVRTVNSTSGSITDRLRSDWQLINVLKELNLPKYEKLGMVESIEGKNGQNENRIIDWTKRNDHRHHAMDALTVAFTKPAFIQYLNNLNARSDKSGSIYGIEQKYLKRDNNNKLIFVSPLPISVFRAESKKHLESILVSFKSKNKVVTRNKNKIKVKGMGNYVEKIQSTPRGQLHKETIYGNIKRYVSKDERIGTKFDLDRIKLVANLKHREALLKRLAEFENDPKKAFGGKNSLIKNPIFLDEGSTVKLPEKVKLVWEENFLTTRKDISSDLVLDKIIDSGVKRILKDRLHSFNDDPKKAFSNLEENPIWLNQKKGISIKRVTISGVNNAIPIHSKKDHFGNYILDEKGNKQPVDFVSTGNNHHVAIYRDEKGNLQEDVVSFFEAVERKNQDLPVINKTFKQELGWEFLYTMKQNEYFVFPSDGFDPGEIDLLNPDNASLISPNLYRVQKIGSLLSGFWFRHHLETNVEVNNNLKGITYKVIQSSSNLEKIIKVRINHVGKIVTIGEY
ncbi:MAG: type II CRISPR RNA-guided endonuclease Cas9 [Bacteroidales bacterium]|nr:type II CRISPR RNA-guided endonuclease Cas9 [Bacteroidales bacterium]